MNAAAALIGQGERGLHPMTARRHDERDTGRQHAGEQIWLHRGADPLDRLSRIRFLRTGRLNDACETAEQNHQAPCTHCMKPHNERSLFEMDTNLES